MTTNGMEAGPTTKIFVPGIFGSPQPSQVRRGSFDPNARSRWNASDVPSRFIKITPAFAYHRKRAKSPSRADVRRAAGRANMAAATKAIRNQPAWNGSRSRLS